jgi:multicomponent Na+:H+ antiporter subunit B
MRPYRDSPVVTKTIRVVAPFVLTFGLFTLLHGTKSVGGGFQGGVIVATVVVALAFGFGVGQIWAALRQRALVGAATAGLVLFGLVAAGSLLRDRPFLDLTAYPVPTEYVIELVEVGIGVTVAGVITLLFFELAGVTDE